MTTDPRELRIGNAERDHAIELLQQHASDGRLTADEFETRKAEALAARYERDLEPLFVDLPDLDQSSSLYSSRYENPPTFSIPDQFSTQQNWDSQPLPALPAQNVSSTLSYPQDSTGRTDETSATSWPLLPTSLTPDSPSSPDSPTHFSHYEHRELRRRRNFTPLVILHKSLLIAVPTIIAIVAFTNGWGWFWWPGFFVLVALGNILLKGKD